MNEAEWLACTDPTALLDYLHSRTSDRKLRLFACIGCRRFWNWLDPERDQSAVDVGEQIADGKSPRQENADAHIRGWDLDLGEEDAYYPALGAACIAEVCAADRMGKQQLPEVYRAAEARERGTLCELLRDICGNPFRPFPAKLSWLAWNDCTIPKMAQAIYDARAFDRLPQLADALEAAGCDNRDIVDHCRSGGDHVRGCWVVDILLGKS